MTLLETLRYTFWLILGTLVSPEILYGFQKLERVYVEHAVATTNYGYNMCVYVYTYVCTSYQLLTYPDHLEIRHRCIYM